MNTGTHEIGSNTLVAKGTSNCDKSWIHRQENDKQQIYKLIIRWDKDDVFDVVLSLNCVT